MITGKLQRRWAEDKPSVYNRDTRTVCMDIVSEKRVNEEGVGMEGWSFLQVEIDRQIDYGHIKSQLIEAGFAQKDEFGLLMNAVEALIEGDMTHEDIVAFREFCAYRKMCAEAAKAVMQEYKA